MKIIDVRLYELEGRMDCDGEFWEERLVRPIDLYPEHRNELGRYLTQEDGRYVMRSIFLEIDTDEGVTGLAGPVDATQAYHINQLRGLIVGADPRAHERIWDQLYRSAVHGRKGVVMQAISAVDCALWDLKGKWLGASVCHLLGGPTRDTVPAYASALGYSLEPEAVERRARELVDAGYGATKWFFRHGPWDGREGMTRNEQLARVLRESVGEDVEIMLDCWMSWDVPYALAMAERLTPYRPRWLEEPVLPDRIDACAQIRRAIDIPVSTGEHEYTRWGFRQLIEAGAADVLQPDIYWAGGISEVMRICALASTNDLVVIPHGHSVPATIHLVAAHPADVCPWVEHLVKWNQVHQFFFREPVQPENGVVRVPEGPGMGVEIDESKVVSRRDLSWS
ncbi:enolase C-terminal domain-like protein [Candidatus Latescibacterota bacterium]